MSAIKKIANSYSVAETIFLVIVCNKFSYVLYRVPKEVMAISNQYTAAIPILAC